MKKMNIGNASSLLSLLLVASVISACSGNVAPATDTSSTMISGLTYDPVTKAIFTVNSSGNLCTLNANQIPGNVNCTLTMPSGIVIASQVVSDGDGNIYSIGRQDNGSANYILKYNTPTKTWTNTPIELPYLANRNKVLYRDGNLYTSDPNTKALYVINIANNTLQKTDNYFIESQAIVEDFDTNGNLFFSHSTNNLNQATFRTDLATTIYTLPSGTSGNSATQFGLNNVNINDLVFAKNNIYGCAESNFLYLPVNSTSSDSWQILSNGSSYFSCDYITTDNSNLYYVEGTWVNNETFSNGYINKNPI